MPSPATLSPEQARRNARGRLRAAAMRQALAACGGSCRKAAAAIGVSMPTFCRDRRELGLLDEERAAREALIAAALQHPVPVAAAMLGVTERQVYRLRAQARARAQTPNTTEETAQ